jgi:hypothetical protein
MSSTKMQTVNPREQRERPQDLHVDIVMVLEFGVMIALVSLVFQLLYNNNDTKQSFIGWA